MLRKLLCKVIGHNDYTVPGTRDLPHGAEMKQCRRCERVGWVIEP